MTTLIALSAVRYDPELLRRLPYLRFAAERGFSHVGALRDRTVRLVIITEVEIDAVVVDYYLRDVAGFREDELPGVKSRVELVQPRHRPNLALDALTLHDELLIARLRRTVDGAEQARLVNFAASADTDLLSAALGVPAEQAPHDLTERWGSKSGGKYILRRSGVPTPDGVVQSVYSWNEVVSAVRQLGKRTSTSDLVAVKLSDPKWGSAIGTVIMNRSAIASSGDPERAIVKTRQYWPDFVREMEFGGAIVEEYVEDVIASPSGQAFIDMCGTVHIISTHDQILIDDEYMGCVHPASAFVDRIRAHLRSVGLTLAEFGIRGYFGVDFIARPNGELLATEANIRKVGPNHVVAQVRDAIGENIDIYYVHRRMHRPELLADFTASRIIGTLREEGLLFDRRSRRGVLLHMLSAISSCGYIETTCIGTSMTDALALDRQLSRKFGLLPWNPGDQGYPVPSG